MRSQAHLVGHGLLLGGVVAAGVLAIEYSQGMNVTDIAKVVPIIGAAWLGGAVTARWQRQNRVIDAD